MSAVVPSIFEPKSFYIHSKKDKALEKKYFFLYNREMEYEVTALKSRPQQFSSLVGQEFVAETLKNSVANGRIAHAYLFSGPRGCGKTSSARILAKAVNCLNPRDGEPCCECQNCREITAGSSADVIEIDGASNTGVNDVRQIREDVMFPPSSCKYKIFIIDEVHMLSTSAFNALLKTIEEPPPYVIFIFATTETHKVPATIKSRCQHYSFRLVSMENIVALLSKAASGQGVKADDDALMRLAVASTGSVRDSYTLFDQAVTFCGSEMTAEKVQKMLGDADIAEMNAFFDICADGDITGALSKIDDLLQTGLSVEQLVVNCTVHIRKLLFIKAGVVKAGIIGENPANFSAKTLATWNLEQLEDAISIFLRIYRDISTSMSPRFDLEVGVIRLAQLSKMPTIEDLSQQVESVRSFFLSGAVPKASKPNAEGEIAKKVPPYEEKSVAASPAATQTVHEVPAISTAASVSDSKDEPPSKHEVPDLPKEPAVQNDGGENHAAHQNVESEKASVPDEVAWVCKIFKGREV